MTTPYAVMFLVWLFSFMLLAVYALCQRADVKNLLEMLNASRLRADKLNDIVAHQRAQIDRLYKR